MTLPKYPIQNIDENSYAFMSVGKNGIILKLVAFENIEGDLYNLGFGDYDFSTGGVNDISTSDNGDMEKVLATVIEILDDFLAKNPTYTVYFSGSTDIRTRLYQIAITTYYDEFTRKYEIFGRYQDTVEHFQKNKKYESFLIRKLL